MGEAATCDPMDGQRRRCARRGRSWHRVSDENSRRGRLGCVAVSRLRRSCIRPRCLVVRSAPAAGFNDQVRRDFRDGDILRMGGWLLSRTELRLCALVALEVTQRTGATGVFSPQRLPTGEDLFWTAPNAHFVLPASATSLEFQFRSGAPAASASRRAYQRTDDR